MKRRYTYTNSSQVLLTLQFPYLDAGLAYMLEKALLQIVMCVCTCVQAGGLVTAADSGDKPGDASDLHQEVAPGPPG